MLKIERDTHSRGTPARPQYVIFLRFGSMPPQEMWLDAKTDEDAITEATRRLPGCQFELAD